MSSPHDHDPVVVDVEGDRVRGVRALGIVLIAVGAFALALGVWLLRRADGEASGAGSIELSPAVAAELDGLRERVRARPGEALPLAELARRCALHGLAEEALANYERALELEPGNADWGHHAALAQRAAGDEDGAFARLNELVLRFEDHAPLRWSLYEACQRRGMSEESMEHLARVAALLGSEQGEPGDALHALLHSNGPYDAWAEGGGAAAPGPDRSR